MTTQIIFPTFCDVDTWRNVIKNNHFPDGRKWAHFIIESDETMIGKTLVEAGFFSSTSEVKRNQPDLFKRTRQEPFETVVLSWAVILIVPLPLSVNGKRPGS